MRAKALARAAIGCRQRKTAEHRYSKEYRVINALNEFFFLKPVSLSGIARVDGREGAHPEP